MRRALLAMAVLLLPASAAADRIGLRYDPWSSGTITILGSALVVANGLFEEQIAPDSCRWCDRGPGGRDTLNGLDAAVRELRLSDPRLVRKWGDIAIWRLLPQVSVGMLWLIESADDRYDDGVIDGLIVLESTLIAALGTQVVRYVVARERPYVHFLASEDRAGTDLSPDASSSFFSGHASVSFCMAVAAGTIATMRRSRWAPLVWALGLSLASLAAYSRIAADLHYFTDVTTGVLFGSAVGFAVPYFLHGPTEGQ